ncbi:MAG: sigma-70 family RNA polymerase sigma factor [Sandaracinaceae bacterium]|nr:sigma-70 family RNA polymerase sigma factor [Sandaracinaceae bacterium]
MLAPAVPEFAQVFEDHADYVYRILHQMRVPPSDVEDVMQEVFLVVHRRLSSFEPGTATLKTWLWEIAWRTASDHRRRAHRRYEESSDTLDHTEGSARAPDHEVASRRTLALLERALARLPEEQRMVFVMFDVEGVPMDHIAATMECPLKTAYSRLRLARESLRAALGGEVGRE